MKTTTTEKQKVFENDAIFFGYITMKREQGMTVFKLGEDKDVTDYAEKYMNKVYDTDKEGYDLTNQILKDISIGGLWYGIHIAQALVYRSLKSYKQFRKVM